MNTDVKTKWLEALRSGEYRQGTRVLSTGDRFCCLGVLCELAAKEGVVEKFEKELVDLAGPDGTDSLEEAEVTMYDDAYCVLPDKVTRWAGLEEANPLMLKHRLGKDNLAAFNDAGASFDMIADAIEEDL